MPQLRPQLLHTWGESSKSLRTHAETFHRQNSSYFHSEPRHSCTTPKTNAASCADWYPSPFWITTTRAFLLGVCLLLLYSVTLQTVQMNVFMSWAQIVENFELNTTNFWVRSTKGMQFILKSFHSVLFEWLIVFFLGETSKNSQRKRRSQSFPPKACSQSLLTRIGNLSAPLALNFTTLYPALLHK